MVGQENKQVRLADAKRNAESNGTRSSQICRSFPPSPLYSIMTDETTDSSNRAQVVIYLRWVDNSLNAHEDFIGLQQVDIIILKTSFMNLRLTGAKEDSVMVEAEYCLEPKQVLPQTLNQYINQEPSSHNDVGEHISSAHSLNLTASDSMKTSPILKDAPETTHEITKLIKYSPKRDAKLEQNY